MYIALGDKARDAVTGFEGIAVCRSEWLNGCVRVTLQPTVDANGVHRESQTIDEPQLEVVTAAAVSIKRYETGGPIPKPRQHPDPVR